MIMRMHFLGLRIHLFLANWNHTSATLPHGLWTKPRNADCANALKMFFIYSSHEHLLTPFQYYQPRPLHLRCSSLLIYRVTCNSNHKECAACAPTNSRSNCYMHQSAFRCLTTGAYAICMMWVNAAKRAAPSPTSVALRLYVYVRANAL